MSDQLLDLYAALGDLMNGTEGTYKSALIGKLSMKVSDYYKSALAAANSTDHPSSGFFPPVSIPLFLANRLN